MNFELPTIYPITDARVSGISHAEQVERLFAGGATLIQLREKHASPAEFLAAAAEAIRVARKLGVKIVINDGVDIALALQADGVHLGQDDLPPGEARALLGESAIIGYSTHSVEQAIEASETAARTGKIGDGKIFVYDLQQVVRIRTGETGKEAL